MREKNEATKTGDKDELIDVNAAENGDEQEVIDSASSPKTGVKKSMKVVEGYGGHMELRTSGDKSEEFQSQKVQMGRQQEEISGLK